MEDIFGNDKEKTKTVCEFYESLMNDFIGKFADDEQYMTKYIILTNSTEVVRVSPERIVYIISDGNYSSMMLIDNGKHTFSFNLSTLEKIIEQQHLINDTIFIGEY